MVMNRLRAVGLPYGFPHSHVLNKIPGEQLSISWNIENIGNEEGQAHLELFIDGSLVQMPGNGLVPAQIQVILINNHTLSVALAEGAHTARVDMVGGGVNPGDPQLLIASHNFTVNISIVSAGPILQAVGDPIIS